MAKGGWKKVQNVKAFLERRGNMRSGPHAMKNQICHWFYCAHCGTVALKNDATRKKLKAVCTWEE